MLPDCEFNLLKDVVQTMWLYAPSQVALLANREQTVANISLVPQTPFKDVDAECFNVQNNAKSNQTASLGSDSNISSTVIIYFLVCFPLKLIFWAVRPHILHQL